MQKRNTAARWKADALRSMPRLGTVSDRNGPESTPRQRVDQNAAKEAAEREHGSAEILAAAAAVQQQRQRDQTNALFEDKKKKKKKKKKKSKHKHRGSLVADSDKKKQRQEGRDAMLATRGTARKIAKSVVAVSTEEAASQPSPDELLELTSL